MVSGDLESAKVFSHEYRQQRLGQGREEILVMVAEGKAQDWGSVGSQLGEGSSVGATLIWVLIPFPEWHRAVSPWASEPIPGTQFSHP